MFLRCLSLFSEERKLKMKKAIIILIGLCLFVGVISTGSYDLSEENTAIYEQAAALETDADNFGFDGFAFTNYPVAFYDGDRDYVLSWHDNSYEITKRKAVLDFTVATAYPIDGHYEVLSPTVEKMSSLLGLLSTGSSDYGAEEHTATLWHEAFHCYQLTNYLENIENICPFEVNERIISEYADTNDQAVGLYEQQSQLLKKSLYETDIDKLRENIVKYKQLDEERTALLSDEINAAEEYYTRVEGTARYIEACVYKLQLPESFEENYIDNITGYGGGTVKYYSKGMAMCMILDNIAPDWKAGYDFSEPLISIIYSELEI